MVMTSLGENSVHSEVAVKTMALYLKSFEPSKSE